MILMEFLLAPTVPSPPRPQGEDLLGLCFLELVVNCKHAGRRSILAAQTVTAADDGDVILAGVCQSGNNIQIQRLALCAGLFGAVHNCNLLGSFRNGLNELVSTERTIQTDLDDTDFFTLCIQVIDNFFCNVAEGAHGDDHAVSIGCAVVVEQFVVSAEFGIDLVHVILNDLGDCIVVLVGSFTVL